MLVVVAIVQFGLLLNTNVTLTNAAREGARSGTIYEYNVQGGDQTWNDARRCEAITTAATAAFGILKNTSPFFVTNATCTSVSADVWTNGDVRVEYVRPASVSVNTEREGYQLTVTLTYRQDIIVPLIGNLLSRDATGRFVQQAQVTMVVN